MDVYYRIRTLVDDPAEPDKDWYETFRRVHACGHEAPKGAVDVVVSRIGENVPFTFVQMGPLVYLGRTDFLEGLGNAVDQYFVLGAVYNSARTRINSFNTIGAPQIVTLRGDRESTREICRRCGKLCYFPLGRNYILEDDLKGQSLYLATRGVIVNAELYATLRNRNWRKVSFEKLPVLKEPEDGLPVNLDEVRPEDIPPRRRPRS